MSAPSITHAKTTAELIAAILPDCAVEDFRAMVKRHDLTYVYADDPAAYQRGSAQLIAIIEAAKHLPREVVVRVWNECVDEKIVPALRDEFYWRVGQ